jgi:prevent-host-death family protein
MREIGAFEAKNKLGTLLDWVEAGEEILITRRGKPVARLVPDTQQAQAAAARIRSRAQALKRGAFNWQEWKALRDEARP